MEELYATGEYVCYMEWEDEKGLWFTEEPEWDDDFIYKLIHKHHAHIAKAVAEDSSAEIKCTKLDDEGNIIENDISEGFFETYNVNWDYELKESKPKQDTISISDGNKVYEFEKPDFECELLKVVGDMIIGWATFTDNSGITAMVWYLEGNKFGFKYGEERRYSRSLTTIQQKKEWHEDKDNFPALLVEANKHFVICVDKDMWVDLNEYNFDEFRLAKKAERDSLFCLEEEA